MLIIFVHVSLVCIQGHKTAWLSEVVLLQYKINSLLLCQVLGKDKFYPEILPFVNV